MAGLDPAIHVLTAMKKDVDARDKRGHDEQKQLALRSAPSCPSA
jgi:hypothetical protein